MGKDMNLEAAAKALVDRLHFIHEDPQYKGVWTFAHVHGNPYKGPTYEQELKALEAALAAPEPSSAKGPTEVTSPSPTGAQPGAPRCAKCDAAAWSIRDGKTVCHYCQTPFPASGPSQDSQEVREAVHRLLRSYRCQHTKGEDGDGASLLDVLSPGETVAGGLAEIDLLTDEIAETVALLSQSPKGAAGPDRALAMETLLVLACKELIRRTGNIESWGCWSWWQGKEEGLEGGGDGEPSAPKTGLRGADAPGEGATCAWSYADPETGEWVTDCGTSWCFTDGDPIENEVKFCVGCGKPVEVLPEEPAPGDVGSAGGADHG